MRLSLRSGYLGLALADTLLAALGPRAHSLRWATKPLLMPALAASLRSPDRAAGRSPGRAAGRAPGAAPTRTPRHAAGTAAPRLRRATLAGLASGWAGDIALLGEGETCLVAGAAAFGAGHVCYIAGFCSARRRPAAPTRATCAAVAIAGSVGPMAAAVAARRSRALGPVVGGYAALLCGTVAAAGQLEPTRRRRSAVAGAALFLASDGLIAARTFGPARLRTGVVARALDGAVMAGYAAAQYLIADASR